jgi:fructosamine-3-kinase
MHAECTASRYGELLREARPGYSSWPALFSALWARRLDAVIAADRLDGPTLDAVGWIHKNLNQLVATNDVPRLVHGNFSGSRVLCHPQDGKWKVSGILEPALLFGHHEIDLALLEFLCGVDKNFFECYTRNIPISEGFELRKHVYMLYYALEDVRLYGNTHHILAAVEYTREVLHRCGC